MADRIIKKASKAVCVAILASLLLTEKSMADSALRQNGTTWIKFGPALLNSCQRIEFRFGLNSAPIILTAGDSKFVGIRSWLTSHFEGALNISPETPCYATLLPDNSVALYSEKSGAYEKLLAEIPLTELTMRKKGAAFQTELSKLKQLLKIKDR